MATRAIIYDAPAAAYKWSSNRYALISKSSGSSYYWDSYVTMQELIERCEPTKIHNAKELHEVDFTDEYFMFPCYHAIPKDKRFVDEPAAKRSR